MAVAGPRACAVASGRVVLLSARAVQAAAADTGAPRLYAVIKQINGIVGSRFSLEELVALLATPQPVLARPDGQQQTAPAALAAGNSEPVLELIRWIVVRPDEGAPTADDVLVDAALRAAHETGLTQRLHDLHVTLTNSTTALKLASALSPSFILRSCSMLRIFSLSIVALTIAACDSGTRSVAPPPPNRRR